MSVSILLLPSENMRVNIKPLSVNEAWQGRRFKTDKYAEYEEHFMYLLRGMDIPDGRIKVDVTFAFSNTQSDIDNPIKPFLDVLQKKYRFNDKMIYDLHIHKEIVEKGKEYIEFSVSPVIHN